MAGAFVHWRQVGNLVFNDQPVSLRFTFQSPPFCPHIAEALLHLESLCSRWRWLLTLFLLGKKNVLVLFCLLRIGIKEKEMENLLKLAQWSNIAREKANVYCVWMVLSYLINANWGEANSPTKHWDSDLPPTFLQIAENSKPLFLLPGWSLRDAGQRRRIQNWEADDSNLSSLKGDGERWQLSNSLPKRSKEKWLLSGYSSSGQKFMHFPFT